jgi:hypothetical protein
VCTPQLPAAEAWAAASLLIGSLSSAGSVGPRTGSRKLQAEVWQGGASACSICLPCIGGHSLPSSLVVLRILRRCLEGGSSRAVAVGQLVPLTGFTGKLTARVLN